MSTSREEEKLAEAAKRGDLAEVQTCLDNGADVNWRDQAESTPLHYASEKGHVDVAKILLDHGAKIDATSRDGWTPLHLASMSGREGAVQMLFERGANIDATEKRLKRTPLHLASTEGHVVVVKILLANGANIDATSRDGATPLHHASEKDHVDVVKTLVENGANADATSRGGRTPLHRAAKHGRVDVVKFLLENGANLDATDIGGSTPLHRASKHGRVDVVTFLLQHGANIDATDQYGCSPLHRVSRNGDDAVVKILVENGANIHATDDDGETPLYCASDYGHVDVVEILLEKGADVTASTTFQTTPLHCASEKGRVDVVKMLLEHGASVSATECASKTGQQDADDGNLDSIKSALTNRRIEINAQDLRKQTALAKAAENGNLEVVQLLLDHGADTSIQDKNGNMCLELALEDEHYTLVIVLIARGTPVNNVLFKDKLVLEWVAPFLTHDVALTLLKLDFPVERNDHGVVTTRDHHSFSWTTFLDLHVPVDSAVRVAVVYTLLSNEDDDWIRELTTAKDQNGREALHTTDAATRDFLNGLRFFCGRYEIFDGPPIHVSSTAVVVNAYDHGLFKQVFDTFANENGELDKAGFIACGRVLGQQPSAADIKKKVGTAAEFDLWDKDQSGQLSASEYLRYCDQTFGGKLKVAMKFMRNADEHAREVETRDGLDIQFVLGLLPALPQETFHANVGALKLHGGIIMKNYPNVLVMPSADRSLEDIFLKERPNDNQIRSMLYEVAEALQHLHANGVVHGDLKKLNVLRVNNHMRLIDMDAATPIGKPIGAKFSSGSLPPDMFYKLKNDSEAVAIAAHWHDHVQANPDLWAKVQPREGYCVKTFHDLGMSETLPFKPVKASPALDVWAFGVLMYQMYSGVELVPTDINQDVDEGGIVRAATWTDAELAKRLKNKVSNELARDLITQLLSVDPDDRISVKDVLVHPYFQVKSDTTSGQLLEKVDALKAQVGTGFQDMTTRVVEVADVFKEILVVSKETLAVSKEALAVSKQVITELAQAKADIMRGIFEATEVAFPTSFVILSVDLTKPLHDDPKYVLRDTASFVQRGLQLVDDFMDAVKDNTVVSRALQLVHPGDPLFLYLIDEVNGVPVIPDSESSLYPIRIDTRSDEYTTFMSAALPYLQSGCQLLKGANTIAAFLSILRVPSLDRETVNKLVDQIEDAKKTSSVFDFDVVQSALEKEGVPVQHIRGAALRELERFFNQHDADKDFSGLCRTYAMNGQALWTTKETIEEVDQGRIERMPLLKPNGTTTKGGGKTAQEIYIDLLLQNHAEAQPPVPSVLLPLHGNVKSGQLSALLMPQHGSVKVEQEKSCCATM